jgi:hypothetical protein
MDQNNALTTTGNVFGGIQAFEDAQRIAKALASSTLDAASSSKGSRVWPTVGGA